MNSTLPASSRQGIVLFDEHECRVAIYFYGAQPYVSRCSKTLDLRK